MKWSLQLFLLAVAIIARADNPWPVARLATMIRLPNYQIRPWCDNYSDGTLRPLAERDACYAKDADFYFLAWIGVRNPELPPRRLCMEVGQSGTYLVCYGEEQVALLGSSGYVTVPVNLHMGAFANQQRFSLWAVDWRFGLCTSVVCGAVLVMPETYVTSIPVAGLAAAKATTKRKAIVNADTTFREAVARATGADK